MIFLKRYKRYTTKIISCKIKLFNATINDLILSFRINIFLRNESYNMSMINLNVLYHHRRLFNQSRNATFKIFDNFNIMPTKEVSGWPEFAQIILPHENCKVISKTIYGQKNGQKKKIVLPLSNYTINPYSAINPYLLYHYLEYNKLPKSCIIL